MVYKSFPLNTLVWRIGCVLFFSDSRDQTRRRSTFSGRGLLRRLALFPQQLVFSTHRPAPASLIAQVLRG